MKDTTKDTANMAGLAGAVLGAIGGYTVAWKLGYGFLASVGAGTLGVLAYFCCFVFVVLVWYITKTDT